MKVNEHKLNRSLQSAIQKDTIGWQQQIEL